MQGFGSGRLVLTPKIYRDIPIDSQGIVSYTTLALLKQLIAELKKLETQKREGRWSRNGFEPLDSVLSLWTRRTRIVQIPIDVGFEIERLEQKVCSGRVF